MDFFVFRFLDFLLLVLDLRQAERARLIGFSGLMQVYRLKWVIKNSSALGFRQVNISFPTSHFPRGKGCC